MPEIRFTVLRPGQPFEIEDTTAGVFWTGTVTGISRSEAPGGRTIAVEQLRIIDDTAPGCQSFHAMLADLDAAYLKVRIEFAESCGHRPDGPPAGLYSKVVRLAQTLRELAG